MSATMNAVSADFELPDLLTRLNWGPVIQLKELNDDQKQEFIRQWAERKGMQMPEEAAQFVLRNCSRDMGSLIGLMEQLDRESLAAQRRLTVPFVKSILE